ncbi:cell division protein DedD [Shewanella sp. UCD-KL12]|uniref:cell division protein DedD n=1 Tax=Shewanella sp. UCD-KL12 TaxID=1917163 RepID=UPI00097121D5|nr:cell division protein DedD [Shewanella sp. UCD-KL12]
MDTKEKQQVPEQNSKVSNHFQNRLVGVIVFVALGVIFLPDILDGKKVHQEEQFAEIPLRPEVAELTLPDDAIQAVDLSDKEQAFESDDQASEQGGQDTWELVETNVETTKPVETAKVSPETKPKRLSEAKAETSSETKPKQKPAQEVVKPTSAYTLQLGSFNNAANVKGLVSKLRAGGFNAYTLPATPVDGKLTKVFVGPETSESKIKSLQPGVEKLTKLKGRIVAYSPTAS